MVYRGKGLRHFANWNDEVDVAQRAYEDTGLTDVVKAAVHDAFYNLTIKEA